MAQTKLLEVIPDEFDDNALFNFISLNDRCAESDDHITEIIETTMDIFQYSADLSVEGVNFRIFLMPDESVSSTKILGTSTHRILNLNADNISIKNLDSGSIIRIVECSIEHQHCLIIIY